MAAGEQARITRRTSIRAGLALGLVGHQVARTGRAWASVGAPTKPTADRLPLVPAAPADALVDMVGVRLAMNEANSGFYGDVSLVLDALRAGGDGLGIRHAREQIVLPAQNETKAATQSRVWPKLAAMGVDFTCLLGDPDDRDGTVAEFARYIKHHLGGNRGMVVAVENANEPNAASKSWNLARSDAWVELCRRRQRQMAVTFRTDPALDGIKLLGPSISGGAGLLKYQNLGDLSPYVDRGNFHYDPGIRKSSVPTAELATIMQGVGVNAPGCDVFCTETGMHQARHSTSPMAYHPGWVAGIYMPRLLLDHFRHGVARVFIMELLDDHRDPRRIDPSSHFGLLRYNRAGMEPKPAYHSMKRLLNLVRDPGAPFPTADLALRVSGAPPDYRQVLLQKRDGRHYLCMWRDVSIWNQTTNRPRDVVPSLVRLRLRLPATCKVYNVSKQTAPTLVRSRVDELGLSLAANVKVVEIRP